MIRFSESTAANTRLLGKALVGNKKYLFFLQPTLSGKAAYRDYTSILLLILWISAILIHHFKLEALVF
ncbi:MAG: hypothetical protein HC817_04005 [Saprospiraceae bacterium]|nr:hypothetical protein [Saprospiraceae bacterium]